jgi:hypothetical protein
VENQLRQTAARILLEPFIDLFQSNLKSSWVRNNFNENLKERRIYVYQFILANKLIK